MLKSWKVQDQSPVPMDLVRGNLYYLHSRAWSIKGYLGGTHSYMTFWSDEHDRWLVVEITDMETIDVQKASAIHIDPSAGYLQRTPVISDRLPNARWFGTVPRILGSTPWETDQITPMINACRDYPIKEFNLLTANCNTFTSYLRWYFGLPFGRPLRSIGYKGERFWTEKYEATFRTQV